MQKKKRLGLSRPTVWAAFQYLSNKGLVVRKRGAGRLRPNERIDRDVELTSLYDDLAAAGRSPDTKVIRNEVTHASDAVAAALQLPEPAMVVSLDFFFQAEDGIRAADVTGVQTCALPI